MLSQMKLVHTLMRVRHTKDTHRMQKRLMVVGAMIGFVALVGAYATTGQIIPGIF